MFGSNLQGSPITAAAALRSTLGDTLAWIPITLAVIALAHRFPVTRTRWHRTIWIHIVACALLVYCENIIVVLTYRATQPGLPPLALILRQGLYWTALRAHVGALVCVAVAASTQAIGYYRETRARELRLARLEGQLARARLECADRADPAAFPFQHAAHHRSPVALRPQR